MGGLFGGTLFGGSPAATTGTPLRDLIYHAMRLAGITLLSGRLPSQDQYADGLMVFNRMTGSWNTISDNIYTVNINQYPTVAQKQAYTLGPGGDWDAPRPQRTPYVNLLFNTAPTIRRAIEPLSDAQWADKRLQQVYSIPLQIYDDGANPLRNLYFYPIPDTVYQIELFTWQSLTKAVAVEDLLAYPDGYEQAIVFGLAKGLMPMFRKRMSDAANDGMILREAANSLSALQSLNHEAPKIATDPTLIPGHGKGYWNWMSGQMEP